VVDSALLGHCPTDMEGATTVSIVDKGTVAVVGDMVVADEDMVDIGGYIHCCTTMRMVVVVLVVAPLVVDMVPKMEWLAFLIHNRIENTPAQVANH